MKREASAAADLHDLEARTGPIRPGWLWGLLAFVTAATLTAFALALSSPFGANGLDAIPAYDAGFVDGLRGGAEVAGAEATALEAIAFGRGQDVAQSAQSGRGNAFPNSAWLREAVQVLNADGSARLIAGEGYARGYAAGYASAELGESE
jgi:hypothetical protein